MVATHSRPKPSATKSGKPRLTPFAAKYRRKLYQLIMLHGTNNRAKILTDNAFTAWTKAGVDGDQKLNHEFEKLVAIVKKMDPDNPVKIVVVNPVDRNGGKKSGQTHLDGALAEDESADQKRVKSNIDKYLDEEEVKTLAKKGSRQGEKRGPQTHSDETALGGAAKNCNESGMLDTQEASSPDMDTNNKCLRDTKDGQAVDNSSDAHDDHPGDDGDTAQPTSPPTTVPLTIAQKKIISDWNSFKRHEYHINTTAKETPWDELRCCEMSHGMERDVMEMRSPSQVAGPTAEGIEALQSAPGPSSSVRTQQSEIPFVTRQWKALNDPIEISSDEGSNSKMDELESVFDDDDFVDKSPSEQQSSQSSDRLKMDLQRARADQAALSQQGQEAGCDVEAVESMLGNPGPAVGNFNADVQASRRDAMVRLLEGLTPQNQVE
ncbi:unnamed protein product [Sympodiomycopsis kandeliae]